MNDDLNQLERVLREKAAEVSQLQSASPKMLRRARRRMFRNVLSSVVAAGIIIVAASAGLNSLGVLRSDRTIPGGSPGVHSSAPGVTGDTCGAADLRATGALQGAAGSVVGSIHFTNLGATTCTLTGRPTLTLSNPAGDAIPVNVVEVAPQWKVDTASTPEGWPVVRLQPGSVAAVRVRWSSACPQLTVPALWRVDLGSGRGTLDVFGADLTPSCLGSAEASTLEVGPFEPSSGS